MLREQGVPQVGRAVDVPVRDADAQTPQLDVGRWRILIVDPYEPNRRKLSHILQVAGVQSSQVRIAATAEEAEEGFVLHHPSIVMMELIDGERGLHVLEEMLVHDPGVRVILVTAERPESDLVRAAVRMGTFAVVEKPLRHDKIRAILQEIRAEESGIERLR